MLILTATGINSYGQELRPVKGLNGKWGFVDETGKEVVPFIYKKVGEFSEGLAGVKDRGNWGFIDKTGKMIIPATYAAVGDFSEGLARVSSDWACGFIDKTGKMIIPAMYDYVGDFSDGLARVKYNGKWGFINRTGNTVISFEYKDARDFSKGLAQVKIKHKWGYIDKEGRKVIQHIATANLNENNPNATSSIPPSATTQDIVIPYNDNESKNESQNQRSNTDIITLRNGNEIRARVTEISPTEIKYKRSDNLEGPTIVIPKAEVFAINYGNGTREVINTAFPTKNEGVSDRSGKVEIGVSPSFYWEEDLFMFGFCGKMRVGVGNYIRLEVPFTYYLPKTETETFWGIDTKLKYNMWDLSLNMQTIVTKDDKFLLYPLIGVRVSGIKATASAFGESESEKKTVFGMNFGAGFDVKLANKFYFNLEPKYMLFFIDGETGHGFAAQAGFIIRF